VTLPGAPAAGRAPRGRQRLGLVSPLSARPLRLRSLRPSRTPSPSVSRFSGFVFERGWRSRRKPSPVPSISPGGSAMPRRRPRSSPSPSRSRSVSNFAGLVSRRSLRPSRSRSSRASASPSSSESRSAERCGGGRLGHVRQAVVVRVAGITGPVPSVVHQSRSPLPTHPRRHGLRDLEHELRPGEIDRAGELWSAHSALDADPWTVRMSLSKSALKVELGRPST